MRPCLVHLPLGSVRAFPFGNEGAIRFRGSPKRQLEFPCREPQEVPFGNGMRVLTDMLVSVLYHASSDVTLSILVYTSVTCATWSETDALATQRKS